MHIFGGHYRVPGGLDQARLFPIQDLSGSLPGRFLPPLHGSSYPRARLTEAPPGCPSQVGSPLYHLPWTAYSGGSNLLSLSRLSWSAKPTTMYAAHSNFPKYHLSLHLKSLRPPPSTWRGARQLSIPACPPPSWHVCPSQALYLLTCLPSYYY